jgi:hypothetical protein
LNANWIPEASVRNAKMIPWIDNFQVDRVALNFHSLLQGINSGLVIEENSLSTKKQKKRGFAGGIAILDDLFMKVSITSFFDKLSRCRVLSVFGYVPS